MAETLREVVTGISPVVLTLLNEYPRQSPSLRKYYKTCLAWLVRELPELPSKVSVEAEKVAHSLGLQTLRGIKWRQQPKFDPGRQQLHWEHMTQVGDIVDQLIKLPNPSNYAIAEVLLRYQVVWITKDENRRLPQGKRPDPVATYAAARIELKNLA